MKLNLPKCLLHEFLDAQAYQDEMIVTDGLTDSLTDLPKTNLSDINYIKKVRRTTTNKKKTKKKLQQKTTTTKTTKRMTTTKATTNVKTI